MSLDPLNVEILKTYGENLVVAFFLVKLALAERDSKNAVVFFFVGLPNGRPWSQALLAETVKTGDKNRDDFRCMQMSIVKSMRFNFGDD